MNKMKNWTKTVLLSLVVVALLGSVGCVQRTDNVSPASKPANQDVTQGAASGETAASKRTTYPLTVKDASGNEVTFTKAPQRIVSLLPSETEVLFALGLDDFIVGVTEWCDYPEAAKSKPKVGGLQGDLEAILSANPDVVFAGLSRTNQKTLEKLRELNVNVFTVEPNTIDEIMERILLYGRITDRQEQAEQVVARMKAERQNVLEAVKGLKDGEKKKVYVEFSPGWTVGKGEFMHDLITLAGGINVAGETEGWYQISEETIIQANPDVILYAKGVPDLEKTIRERSGWDSIAAIRNGRVIGVDDNLLARPGPRITQALIEIAKAIYPDLVK